MAGSAKKSDNDVTKKVVIKNIKIRALEVTEMVMEQSENKIK